jgi:hypothetical protein
VNDEYSPVKYIRQIAPIPIVIIHGFEDEIVPSHHGRILYDAALEPKQFWEFPVSGHVTALAGGQARSRLLAFLAALP